MGEINPRYDRFKMLHKEAMQHAENAKLQPGDVRPHKLLYVLPLQNDVSTYKYNLTPKGGNSDENSVVDTVLGTNHSFLPCSSRLGVRKVFYNNDTNMFQFFDNYTTSYFADPTVFKGKQLVTPPAGQVVISEADCLNTLYDGAKATLSIETSGIVEGYLMDDFKHIPFAQANNAQKTSYTGEEWTGFAAGKFLSGGNDNNIVIQFGRGLKTLLSGDPLASQAAAVYNSVKNINFLILEIEGWLIKAGSKPVLAPTLSQR
jgi:hypothetical protein